MEHWHQYDGFESRCMDDGEGSCGDHPWFEAARCDICGAWCAMGLNHVVRSNGIEEVWCCDDFSHRAGEL